MTRRRRKSRTPSSQAAASRRPGRHSVHPHATRNRCLNIQHRRPRPMRRNGLIQKRKTDMTNALQLLLLYNGHAPITLRRPPALCGASAQRLLANGGTGIVAVFSRTAERKPSERALRDRSGAVAIRAPEQEPSLNVCVNSTNDHCGGSSAWNTPCSVAVAMLLTGAF